MENLSIRPLEEKDIAFAYEMTLIEQWNDRIDDVRRMFQYEPGGSFIAEMENSRVGHVFTVGYGKLGWIGLLIVKPGYRGKGIGKLLMERAIDYLLNLGVKTIKLDAVPEISDLYRKLGFIDEFDSLRFRGVPKKRCTGSSSTVPMSKERIRKIAQFDADYFGGDRLRIIEALYEANPKLCYATYKDSDLSGYIMCRKVRSGYKLGPFVCDPRYPEVARDLLGRCLEKLAFNATVYVGVPGANGEAIKLFRDFGFEQYSKSIRMYFGKNLTTEKVSGIFAIGGPMKG